MGTAGVVGLIGSGLIMLVIGFSGGILAVKYFRKRKNAGNISPSNKRAKRDEVDEKFMNKVELLKEDDEKSCTAIFEVNIDYQSEYIQVLPHSAHVIRLEQFRMESMSYIPIITTSENFVLNQDTVDGSNNAFMSRLTFCESGAKEPQFHLYVTQDDASEEEKASARAILGICVHNKALIVHELLKRKQKHHILIQRARTIEDNFNTIFVGNAKGKINVKHNRKGIFRILIWWSMDNDLPEVITQ